MEGGRTILKKHTISQVRIFLIKIQTLQKKKIIPREGEGWSPRRPSQIDPWLKYIGLWYSQPVDSLGSLRIVISASDVLSLLTVGTVYNINTNQTTSEPANFSSREVVKPFFFFSRAHQKKKKKPINTGRANRIPNHYWASAGLGRITVVIKRPDGIPAGTIYVGVT